jgi:hypothetical protein
MKKQKRSEYIAEMVGSYRNYIQGKPLNYNWFFSNVTKEEITEYMTQMTYKKLHEIEWNKSQPVAPVVKKAVPKEAPKKRTPKRKTKNGKR